MRGFRFVFWILKILFKVIVFFLSIIGFFFKSFARVLARKRARTMTSTDRVVVNLAEEGVEIVVDEVVSTATEIVVDKVVEVVITVIPSG